jgi:hypothetical protein
MTLNSAYARYAMNGNGHDPQDPPDLGTIIKLMGMTGSAHDAEALSALRMATARLKKWGWTWDSILRGKIKIMPDPFANVPMPATTSRTSSGSRYTPPPPPKQFDNQAEIDGYFTKLEFKTLPTSVNKQIADIERKWKANGHLDYGDYNLLRTTANSRKRY